jgi:hypothetical protein
VPDAADRPQRIPEELVDFFEGGTSILVGTCDAAQRPENARAVGARVARDRRRIEIYLNEATAARTLANLKTNPRIAVCFCRPIDHRTVQVKGRALSSRTADDSEKVVVERYLSAFVEALYLVGMTRSLTSRLGRWPSVVVELEVSELFHQTPGPGAGRRLDA